MSELRRLKLELLADVTKFSKAMLAAGRSSDTFGHKIKTIAKAGTLAFAGFATAVGVAAVALGVDMVKAALEDEKSMKQLEIALKKTTSATDTQVASVEAYIKSAQLAKGFTDNSLRQSFARLVRSTKDVAKAQTLTNLAMDISAATGKDLTTVSMALGKAYDGNLGALKRLGIPLDAAALKTKNFALEQAALTNSYGGAASTAAETYAGKIKRIGEAWASLKEDIGKSLLPGLGRLIDYIQHNVITQLEDMARAIAGSPSSISNKVNQLSKDLGTGDQKSGYSLGLSIRNLASALSSFFASSNSSDAKGAAGTLQNVANSLNSIAGAISNINHWWNSLRSGQHSFVNFLFGKNDNTWFAQMFQSRTWDPLATTGFPKGSATGGMIQGPRIVGERGPELFVPSGQGRVIPNNQLRSGNGVTIVMNGVIDGESARRTLQKLIQDSSKRTGAVNWLGSSL